MKIVNYGLQMMKMRRVFRLQCKVVFEDWTVTVTVCNKSLSEDNSGNCGWKSLHNSCFIEEL